MTDALELGVTAIEAALGDAEITRIVLPGRIWIDVSGPPGARAHRIRLSGCVFQAPRRSVPISHRFTGAPGVAIRRNEVTEMAPMRRDGTGARAEEARNLRAAWRCSGCLVGALAGWTVGLFSTVGPLPAALVSASEGLIWGAIVGAVIALLVHALKRGDRDSRPGSTRNPPYCDVISDVDVFDSRPRLQISGNRKE